MGRNRVIHHSVRHLSSHTKESWEPQPASLDRDDAHYIGLGEIKQAQGSHLEHTTQRQYRRWKREVRVVI